MSKLDKLNKLYAKIPKIQCKGLCHESCTIVPAAKIEIKRARGRMGKNPFNPLYAIKKLTEGDKPIIPKCQALKDNRCSIYTARPAICRLYGVSEGLSCHFGCVPEQTISKEEAYALIREIEAL